MSDLKVEREFAVPPARLFRAITENTELTQWWGPEAMTLSESQLDFTKSGAWFAVIKNNDGETYKMSGMVTHVTPPSSIGLTWGWHDAEDQRGPESFVTLTVIETTKGSKLIIDHRDLTEDAATSHRDGWMSTLSSLETYLTTLNS